MKHILIIAGLVVTLAASYAGAQMGHGMMRDGHKMEQGGHMMGDQGMMGSGGMMGGQDRDEQGAEAERRHMMNSVMGMTQDIAIMMRQMSVMMGDVTDTQGVSGDRISRMSAIMKEMSTEMNRISDLVGKGSASDEEIRTMQNRMIQLQEQMWELRK